VAGVRDDGAVMRVSRRALLAGAAGSALVLAGCSGGRGDAAGGEAQESQAPPPDRAEAAYRARLAAAAERRDEGTPSHESNGDDRREPAGALAYSKGVPHEADGTPHPAAWQALVRAVRSGRLDAVEGVRLGGERRLVNPLAAFSVPLVGLDGSQLALEPPPAVDSDELATELVEAYWMALARDVPFAQWESSPLIADAAAELDSHDVYDGRAPGGSVTPATVFRGPAANDRHGPYVSQFLLLRVPAGSMPIDQRVRAYLPGFDFLTTRDDWRRSQDGRIGQHPSPSTPRFIHTLRDLASVVHRDYMPQLPIHAALILLASSDDNDAVGVTVPYATSSPYTGSTIEGPFATLGQPHVIELLGIAANSALRAAWFQKWLVHWRLRPEEAAGRVDAQRNGEIELPLARRMLDAPVLGRVREAHGSYLLPLAYPDGAPLHPSYPSGHATMAGACVTVLKALFDEDYELADPVVATEDGLGLAPYTGGPLRVGPELDKLATNIAYGRNAGGIHWRSDGDGGIRLGEAVATAILRDVKATLPEPDVPLAFTSFDGERVEL
jgi:membrane-associated phospholipid phosphatase